MSIYLGNLTLEQVERRLGIEISEEDKKKLIEFHCDSANVEKGKWHCFDLPFMFVCGDRLTAEKVVKIFKPYVKHMKQALQVGFQ
jgi:hypothetical protein